MSVSKDEASSALHDIEATERRSRTLFGYGLASPYLLLWGVLWMIAGAVGAVSPANSGIGWGAVDIVGLLGTAYLIVRHARRCGARSDRIHLLRYVGSAAVLVAFVGLTLMIFGPVKGGEITMLFTLLVAAGYAIAGCWIGSPLCGRGRGFGRPRGRSVRLGAGAPAPDRSVRGRRRSHTRRPLDAAGLMSTPDEIVHQSTRLKIMSALNALPRREMLEFVRLKAITGATDGNLGSHLTTLWRSRDTSTVVKDFVGKRPRTRVRITAPGRRAFQSHVAYLRDILESEGAGA